MQNNAAKHWVGVFELIASFSRLLTPTPARRQQTFHFVSRADRWSFKRALVVREKKLRELNIFLLRLFSWGSEMMLIYIRLKFASLRFIHCVEFQATFPLRRREKKISSESAKVGKGSWSETKFLSDTISEKDYDKKKFKVTRNEKLLLSM